MTTGTKQKLNFTLRVIVIHSVTYILCGLFFHQIFDYKGIFAIDVIKNFMRPVSDPAAMAGPFLQPIRGLFFAIGLWIVKPVWISKKNGWLVIWGIIFIFGILNTPAASPSSIEGFLYSRLPLWYHLMGYVEIGVQTLIFSILLFITQKSKEQNESIFDRFPLAGEVVRSIALSCFAYIGYAVTSISLLFLGGYTLEFEETTMTMGEGNTINISEAAGDLKTQGMFLMVFIMNVVFILLFDLFLKKKRIHGVILFGIIMSINIVSLISYQLLFSSVMDPLTLIYLPSLSSLILTICLKYEVFAIKKKPAA
ncbi:MAG: hypothetical protein JW881_06085 [Spirochaetales bacterium]|nr:hypothetical protein [Spirochaetales bacterium]